MFTKNLFYSPGLCLIIKQGGCTMGINIINILRFLQKPNLIEGIRSIILSFLFIVALYTLKKLLAWLKK